MLKKVGMVRYNEILLLESQKSLEAIFGWFYYGVKQVRLFMEGEMKRCQQGN